MPAPVLRHIKKIEYCAAYHLRRAIILPAQSQALVQEPMPWQGLPLVGLASLEVTDEVENGVRLYTSKLTATLCKQFQHPTRPSAFRLTDVQGRQYLLGTALQPFALVAQNENIGNAPSSSTANTLTVNWQNATPILQIRVR